MLILPKAISSLIPNILRIFQAKLIHLDMHAYTAF